MRDEREGREKRGQREREREREKLGDSRAEIALHPAKQSEVYRACI